jgi:hypothetical protein
MREGMQQPYTIRALHLLSDRKFLPWIRRTFSLPHWQSAYIILDPRKKNNAVTLGEDTTELSDDAYGHQIVLEKLKTTDIAFHFFLNNTKADIIARSGKDVVHCWCFYGAEVYQQTNLFRSTLYGPQTRRWLWTFPEIKFRYDFRRLYYTLIKQQISPIASLQRAIPNIYAILWYVEEEMKMIDQKIKLPPWRFFQFFSFADIIPHGTQPANRDSKRILIGNSATIENNHADVLPALSALKNAGYGFSLPLTYGQFPRYKAKVMVAYRKALGDQVTFMESHMPLDEYYFVLRQHPTAVFLHHRQQALGNILYLIYTGTKVYLSAHNIVNQWLSRNGVEVFIFETDFLRDIKAQQLTLDDTTVAKNREAIRHLLDHTRNTETIHQLETEILSRKETRIS